MAKLVPFPPRPAKRSTAPLDRLRRRHPLKAALVDRLIREWLTDRPATADERPRPRRR